MTGAAVGIADGDAAEAKSDAVGAAHQRGRAEETPYRAPSRSCRLPAMRGLQDFEVDRPASEQQGEADDRAATARAATKDRADGDEGARSRPQRRLARTRQRRGPSQLCSKRRIAARALDRVAASMPPIKPLRSPLA